MECQTLDLTVLSAKDLKQWNKNRMYVTVSISGDPLSTPQTTPFSKADDGGSHPRWDHDMRFTINVSTAKEDDILLVLNIRRARCIKHKDIGGVRIPIKELLLVYKKAATGGGVVVSYKIRGLLGKVRGEIEFRYKFFSHNINNNNTQEETGGPTLAYPVYPAPYPLQGHGYPPHGFPGSYAPSTYGYGYPPPAQLYGGPYGHGPSYGHQHQHQHQHQPPKTEQHKGSKIKSKLGIGLGIAGGLIGGLLFGEEASEAISDFVGGGVDDVADLVGAGVADAADVVGGGVADVADVVGAGVTDVVGGGVAGVADTVGGEVADVADVVGGGVADVADVGAGVTDVVGGGVADVADTVGGEVAGVAPSAGDIANLTEATTDAGISAAANVARPLL